MAHIAHILHTLPCARHRHQPRLLSWLMGPLDEPRSPLLGRPSHLHLHHRHLIMTPLACPVKAQQGRLDVFTESVMYLLYWVKKKCY